MKTVFRFTYKTQCGKTNIVIETGATYSEAKAKATRHIVEKHTPMMLIRAEYRQHGTYNWYRCTNTED